MAEGTIGLAEPSTITKSLRTVTQTVNSSVVHQEVMTIGGAGSTLQIAAVTASAPASTEFGLNVRIVSGPSTAADAVIRVNQGLANSSIGDRWPVFFANSSAADYIPVRIVDSSGTAYASLGLDYTDASTASTLAAPSLTYNNGSNATMRLVGTSQPLPVQIRTGTLTFNSTTVLVLMQTAGGSTTLVSSAASVAHKVFAYSVTSTIVATSTVTFLSSAASDVWGLLLGTGSSGVSGANVAVTPPAYLFKTAAGEALGFSASSTGHYRVSISYFTE